MDFFSELVLIGLQWHRVECMACKINDDNEKDNNDARSPSLLRNDNNNVYRL